MMTAQTALSKPQSEGLDRPIWAALTSRQESLAVKVGRARAYPADMAAFAATDPDGSDIESDLVDLVRARPDGVSFMQADPVCLPPTLECARKAMGVQMVLGSDVADQGSDGLDRLSARDVPEMLELVAATEPGPFLPRTVRLGAYWGARRNGRLIAMAGERMRLSGYTEISAVCVDPAHRRTGLARRLVRRVAGDILNRGEVPFLHTYADNHAAIRLYEDMGFRLRRSVHITTVVAAQPATSA